jgi:putative ABC transport system substrate-binding protein
MGGKMRRRELLTLLGGATATWPLLARAQQPRLPIIGYVNLGAEASTAELAGFRKGLAEMGYVEGRNVAVEYRWAQNESDRLPGLIADLIRRRVAVIVAPGNLSALAAKAATATIPVVFATGGDPVANGFVPSLNRPGGNLTGVTSLAVEVGPKRFGLLHELLPQATRFALLVNQTSPNSEALTRDAQTAAASIGRQVTIFAASNSKEIDAAFAGMARERTDALVVNPNGFLDSRRVQIVTLAAVHHLPALYGDRRIAEIGGLMSCGIDNAYESYQTGLYAGRILKGEKPGDLPVIRASKFEFVLNLQTARSIGLDVPPSIVAIADEVIE